MSDKTKIGWTDATWNPTTGCNKISPGCKNCYAKRDWARLSSHKGSVYYGREFEDVATHAERLDQPLRWKKPRRIFVNSMSDLFHEKVSFEFISAVFGVMMGARQHTFQVLTKRPQRVLEFFRWTESGGDCPRERVEIDAICALNDTKFGAEFCICHLGADTTPWPLQNVLLGTSAENQETWMERSPYLRQIKQLGWRTMCSFEPLLHFIDITEGIQPTESAWERFHDKTEHLEGWNEPEEFVEECEEESDWINCGNDLVKSSEHREWERDRKHYAKCLTVGEWLDWAIVGGESGKDARPMNPDWAKRLQVDCSMGDIPFFFKQWGAYQPRPTTGMISSPLDVVFPYGGRMYKPSKQEVHRLLGNKTYDEFPG